MGLGNIFGKTHVTERSSSGWITVVALHPVVFGLSYLYFPKGRHYDKDDQINSGE
jgi:hypothetical protein